jgi:hypothetical protein
MQNDSQTTIVSPGSLHPAGSAIRDVPEGCQEIPGYILDVLDGSAWITQDGQVTDKWQERGVWPTPEAAAEMMQRCLSPNDKLNHGGE